MLEWVVTEGEHTYAAPIPTLWLTVIALVIVVEGQAVSTEGIRMAAPGELSDFYFPPLRETSATLTSSVAGPPDAVAAPVR